MGIALLENGLRERGKTAFWGGKNIVKHDDTFTMEKDLFLFGEAYDIETGESCLLVTSEVVGVYPKKNSPWSGFREDLEYPFAKTASGSKYYLVNPFVDFSTEELQDLWVEITSSSRRRNAVFAFFRKLE